MSKKKQERPATADRELWNSLERVSRAEAMRKASLDAGRAAMERDAARRRRERKG